MCNFFRGTSRIGYGSSSSERHNETIQGYFYVEVTSTIFIAEDDALALKMEI